MPSGLTHMELVESEERLRQLIGAGRGFIYNDFAPGVRPDQRPSKSTRYNTLHRADCRTLQVSLTVVKRFFAAEAEAIGWLTTHRGLEPQAWHRCARCLARSSVAVATSPLGAAAPPTPEIRVVPARPRERELRRLAELLRARNEIDEEVAGIIERPVTPGHLGEFVAAAIFGIELASSASAKAIDGWFTRGPLAGKTVNVKWYGKEEGVLDLSAQGVGADYYLVLTGGRTTAISSKGTRRPWVISHVFLFDGAALLKALRVRGVKITTGGSVARAYWEAAEIYPRPTNPLWALSDEEQAQLALFART